MIRWTRCPTCEGSLSDGRHRVERVTMFGSRWTLLACPAMAGFELHGYLKAQA